MLRLDHDLVTILTMIGGILLEVEQADVLTNHCTYILTQDKSRLMSWLEAGRRNEVGILKKCRKPINSFTHEYTGSQREKTNDKRGGVGVPASD